MVRGTLFSEPESKVIFGFAPNSEGSGPIPGQSKAISNLTPNSEPPDRVLDSSRCYLPPWVNASMSASGSSQ